MRNYPKRRNCNSWNTTWSCETSVTWSIATIKEVFQRINSTDYALNPMEVHNARYEGALKKFGEELAAHDFFERHRIFSSSDVKRMQDLRLVLIIVITMMSTYFNRDDELESYLEKFNDDFEQGDDIRTQLFNLFDFIESAEFGATKQSLEEGRLLHPDSRAE